jgi:hypothetical protein
LGRKKSVATKSRPKANPCPSWLYLNPLPCSNPLLAAGLGGVLVAQVCWGKRGCGEKPTTHFEVGKKAQPMGRGCKKQGQPTPCSVLATCRWLVREKARPTPCSLLLLARSSWWWVGSEMCSRLKFLGANGDVAKSRRPHSVGKKARPMGARWANRGKARPTPCSTPCSLLLAGLLGRKRGVFVDRVF